MSLFVIPILIFFIAGAALKFTPASYRKWPGLILGTGTGIVGIVLSILLLMYTQKKEGIDETYINQVLHLSYWMIAAAIGLWAGYAITHIVVSLIEKPASQFKFFGSLLVLGLVCLISWMVSSEKFEMVGSFEQVEFFKSVPKFAFHLSEAFIFASYILMLLSVVSILFTEIIRRFR